MLSRAAYTGVFRHAEGFRLSKQGSVMVHNMKWWSVRRRKEKGCKKSVYEANKMYVKRKGDEMTQAEVQEIVAISAAISSNVCSAFSWTILSGHSPVPTKTIRS